MGGIMNQIEVATQGSTTKEMRFVAKSEGKNAETIRKLVKNRNVVLMTRDNCRPLGIGTGMRTKINANIGTSSVSIKPEEEVEKAKVAERYGADTVSDLSMGGDIDAIRKEVLKVTTVPITTVPIYQAVVECGSFYSVKESDLLRIVRKHVEEHVSSIVLHAGFTKEMLSMLKKARRIMGMVSKGGSFTSAWMLEHDSENPFLKNFDEFLDILHDRDVVLSLGNTMRSGCIHDLKDRPQLLEIKKNAELAEIANKRGVQVIVECMGGHVNAKEIPIYVKYHKKVTSDRPLFIAGPLPIDVAVGYDHIAACVGASIAAGAGADYLCYITPSEHLSLPTVEDVREGVVAFKIAAHIGDSMKYGLSEKDMRLAERRRRRDWRGQFRYAIDPERGLERHPEARGTCTMCGTYCAIAIMESYLGRGK